MKPKNLSSIGYGGGGPLFMAPIARAVGIQRVLSPALASVLSAFGGGSADVRLERSRSIARVVPLDTARVEHELAELQRLVKQDLDANNIAPEAQTVQFEADVQFLRQSADLTIAVTLPFDERRLIHDFMTAYAALYGKGTIVEGAKIELVSVRAVGIGKTDRVQMISHAAPVRELDAPTSSGKRRVRLTRDAAEEIPVYEATSLLPGHRLQGPALVDAIDNTLWIPPLSSASIDQFSTITIELGEA
jgi:N-methylhydantoinase A